MIDVLTEQLRAPITEETAELYVGGTVFKTGPPERVGVELEWLVQDADRPRGPRPFRAPGRGARRGVRPAAGGTAHHRAGRAAGAQLAARPARRLHRRRRRRPRPGACPRRRRRPDPHRPGPRPPASGPAHRRPAVRRHGAALRPAWPRGPHHDVLDRIRAGLPGRRCRRPRRGRALARAARVAAGADRAVRQLACSRAAVRADGDLGGDRPDPDGRAGRRRPARGVRAVGAGRAVAGDPPGGGVVGGAGRPELPRLAARRRARARAGRAHLGRPGLPPEHAVPAGAGPRPPGAAGGRRAARRRLAGGGRPGRGAARRSRRPRGGDRGRHRGDVALGEAAAATAVACGPRRPTGAPPAAASRRGAWPRRPTSPPPAGAVRR